MPAALAIVLVHYVDIIVSCAHTMPPCRQYSKETIAQIIALRKGGHSIKEVVVGPSSGGASSQVCASGSQARGCDEKLCAQRRRETHQRYFPLIDVL